MIIIKNTQRKIKVDQKALEQAVRSMLRVAGYEDFDIGIWLTTNATIRKFNKKFRKKDKATDILSFPYHTDLKPGQKVVVNSPEDKNLGDIIISLEFANSFAQKDNLTHLLAHGIAHLLGYTHETDDDFVKMQLFEKRLLHLENS